jgi:predicted MPP superfamily phosphohydrolase
MTTMPRLRIRAHPWLGAILAAGLAAACSMSTAEPAGPATVAAPQTPAAPPMALPNRPDSLKFAVLGDFGNGTAAQAQLGQVMFKLHAKFPFELAVLVGDNIYGSQRPQDFAARFEVPYRPLLDAKVKFYASLGNHDSVEQANYPPFNMNGKRYYSFKAPKESVRFFALESTYPTPEQVKWITDELKGSNDDWKIAFFHHPLYSSGERHGSDIQLRETLEPLFVQYNVSVVFTGHDHFYERTKPQKGIPYFVVGSGGQLRRGNIDRTTGLTAKGFDTDLAFLVAEISKDELVFNAISRTGEIIDSGLITRRQPPK